ncbi:beta-ketoacyl synthase chain length factor [Idiomarina abyssalis]|uniref:Beta-ketoacyl synthase chain length factor n=1 Tax=Idiomarina abyssalis TaxID=86102 RepID=A0A8I1GCD4_9GAMM|nr:beta-ketoacyl synthase chain length factor [Idiomarina abyssalis]MBJ7266203.1 beta-ketoacyl synthase chain length factor [Idiomarina abyssalis]MBJ7272740.1 beta-ketoacyl synthase chain length factor [Idiomarina abyssalis]MBJ7316342.1 beta-ketoacyl synthase chain length factor [Idiomarina abyssalis]
MRAFVADSTLVQNECRERLKQIPASTRRRLSSYAKVLITAMLELSERHPQLQETPVVLATRHGDLHRTEKLLRELVRGEILSPTQFALSVNNAVLGQYSMAADNRQSMTTLSAGEQTYPLGWLEALSQLQSEAEQVLLLYADEVPPAVYSGQVKSPVTGFSHAVLLHRKNGQELILDRRVGKESQLQEDVWSVANSVQKILDAGGDKVVKDYNGVRWSWHVA